MVDSPSVTRFDPRKNSVSVPMKKELLGVHFTGEQSEAERCWIYPPREKKRERTGSGDGMGRGSGRRLPLTQPFLAS